MDEKSVLRAADAVATTGAYPNTRGRILATLRTEIATNTGETAPPPDREIVDIGVHLSPSVIAAMERAAAAFDEPPDGPSLPEAWADLRALLTEGIETLLALLSDSGLPDAAARMEEAWAYARSRLDERFGPDGEPHE